ncbi:MAG: NnrU family protein [Gammaproteobacteria bacterium]|jgi:uncharacterized membrane protein|nr:NnrU family protein [Gammaproteobacteria bacterium]
MIDSALLIVGILLWYGAHLFKRVAPKIRKQMGDRMGDRSKGLVALPLLAGIVLMVLGYRGMDRIDLWYPPGWLIYLNNLMMLVAIYLFSPAPRKGALLNGMRHPMLIGFLLLTGAHLLVSGDLASIILFGALGIWAILEIVVINRAEPGWRPGEKGTITQDGLFFAVSVVLLVVIGYVHDLIGPSPFPV